MAAAAAWLRIDELINSSTELVCIVARVQSINSSQRSLVVHEDMEEKGTSSSNLHVSLINLRMPMTILSSGQYVQVYGKILRQGDQIIRIDAQFIRSLGMDFDMNKYVQGLILTRRYMSDIDGENVVDNKICRRMEQ